MKYRAILFDLEGTITNSETLWFEAAGNILTKRTISEDPTFQKKIIGTSIEQACALLKNLHNLPDSIKELEQQLYEEFETIHAKQVPFYPGFLSFFKKIRAQKYACAIATNTPEKLLQQIKTDPSLAELFNTHIYTPETVAGKVKPAPELYLAAARGLAIAPAECIVIEDSIPGVTAAKNAGMFCIRLATTLPTLDTLAGEDIVVPGYNAIPLEEIATKQ